MFLDFESHSILFFLLPIIVRNSVYKPEMSDSVIHFSKDKQISDLIEEGLMKDIAQKAKNASRFLF